MPTQHVPEIIENSTGRLSALITELNEVAESLLDREVVLAIASDSVMADDAYQALRNLVTKASAVSDRMGQVRELSTQIDRLADPLLLGTIR